MSLVSDGGSVAPRAASGRGLVSVPTTAFPAGVLAACRAELPRLADEVLDVIVAEVPAYALLSARDNATLRHAVGQALAHFLRIAERGGDVARLTASTSGAYDLGRGEARSGRSLDALLAAYRIGARVSWQGMSHIAARHGMPAESMGAFAALVFAYIDELSATSVVGHRDELDKTGRARDRYLEQLARLLADGADRGRAEAAAARAAWEPPRTLTAVVMPEPAARSVLPRLDPSTLVAGSETAAGAESGAPVGQEEHVVLLVPDVTDRAVLMERLRGHAAVVGPRVTWWEASRSVRRARAGLALVEDGRTSVDTDEHLVALVTGASRAEVADLRRRVLAPLADTRPAMRHALEETLRAWLLLQGRRNAVAQLLHVHPQTVRYRMDLIRSRYGSALDDPAVVEALVVALAAGPAPASEGASA